MADIEKVKRGLELCSQYSVLYVCPQCPYYIEESTDYSGCIQNLTKDALELLKDQAKRIETLEKINAIDLNPKWPYVFNNYRKVVLCKDCKHYQPDEYDPGKGDCMEPCDNMVKVSDNWFCADGEKKYVRY